MQRCGPFPWVRGVAHREVYTPLILGTQEVEAGGPEVHPQPWLQELKLKGDPPL